LPCGHDGPEAQVVLADYAYNEIIRQYQTPSVISGEYLTLNSFRLTEKPRTRDNETVWRGSQIN
jgi:hypothetical protein